MAITGFCCCVVFGTSEDCNEMEMEELVALHYFWCMGRGWNDGYTLF